MTGAIWEKKLNADKDGKIKWELRWLGAMQVGDGHLQGWIFTLRTLSLLWQEKKKKTKAAPGLSILSEHAFSKWRRFNNSKQ